MNQTHHTASNAKAAPLRIAVITAQWHAEIVGQAHAGLLAELDRVHDGPHTVQRFDVPIAPSVSAEDSLLEFLFSRAPVKYAELRQKAEAREPLAGFRLDGVSITVALDADYKVLRTQLTQNIVAVVEGSDPRLKATYVAMGAHYDHVGYAESELGDDGKRSGSPGRVTGGAERDRIWNGADDDGSGTVALMGLAPPLDAPELPAAP